MTIDGRLKMHQFSKYNESVMYLYFDYVTNGSVLIQSLNDYNDTLYQFGEFCRTRGSFAAHKKGSLRRQHMFTWMASDWINMKKKEIVPSKENTVDYRTKTA
jgi:hypothetical protein